MQSDQTQLFEKMKRIFNLLGEYKSRIYRLSVNSYDFHLLKNHPEFDKLFKLETNTKGEQLLNGVLLVNSPLIATGTFYINLNQ